MPIAADGILASWHAHSARHRRSTSHWSGSGSTPTTLDPSAPCANAQTSISTRSRSIGLSPIAPTANRLCASPQGGLTGSFQRARRQSFVEPARRFGKANEPAACGASATRRIGEAPVAECRRASETTDPAQRAAMRCLRPVSVTTANFSFWSRATPYSFNFGQQLPPGDRLTAWIRMQEDNACASAPKTAPISTSWHRPSFHERASRAQDS